MVGRLTLLLDLEPETFEPRIVSQFAVTFYLLCPSPVTRAIPRRTQTSYPSITTVLSLLDLSPRDAPADWHMVFVFGIES